MEAQIRGIKLDCILTVCPSGGRLDHELSNLHTLLKHPSGQPPLWLLSESCLIKSLSEGQHSLDMGSRALRGQHCGLLPLTGATHVTTSGLRWNLTEKQV